MIGFARVRAWKRAKRLAEKTPAAKLIGLHIGKITELKISRQNKTFKQSVGRIDLRIFGRTIVVIIRAQLRGIERTHGFGNNF
jgi:hypothetical protein